MRLRNLKIRKRAQLQIRPKLMKTNPKRNRKICDFSYPCF